LVKAKAEQWYVANSRQRKTPPTRLSIGSRCHLDTKHRAHILEHDSNRFDDRLAGISLAVLDAYGRDLRGDQLRVILPGARKLSAGQRLNVDISFAICVGWSERAPVVLPPG
jgi:hypothetical protein